MPPAGNGLFGRGWQAELRTDLRRTGEHKTVANIAHFAAFLFCWCGQRHVADGAPQLRRLTQFTSKQTKSILINNTLDKNPAPSAKASHILLLQQYTPARSKCNEQYKVRWIGAVWCRPPQHLALCRGALNAGVYWNTNADTEIGSEVLHRNFKNATIDVFAKLAHVGELMRFLLPLVY